MKYSSSPTDRRKSKLSLPNQTKYIYICKYSRPSFRYWQCLATYAFNSSTALQFPPLLLQHVPFSFSLDRETFHARSRHRPAVRPNRFIDLSINFHSSDSYAWIVASSASPSFRDFMQDFFSPSSPPLGYFSKFTLTAALSPNFVPKLPYISRHRCSRRAVPLVFLVEVERRRRGEGGGHGSCRAMFRRGGRRKTVVRHRAAARLRAQ